MWEKLIFCQINNSLISSAYLCVTCHWSQWNNGKGVCYLHGIEWKWRRLSGARTGAVLQSVSHNHGSWTKGRFGFPCCSSANRWHMNLKLCRKCIYLSNLLTYYAQPHLLADFVSFPVLIFRWQSRISPLFFFKDLKFKILSACTKIKFLYLMLS